MMSTMLRFLSLFIISIGILLSPFESKSEKKDGLVEVEPMNIVPVDKSSGYKMVPYKERREKWGTTFGLSYSIYEPKDYNPDFAIQDFDTIYERGDLPLIEISFGVKRNFLLGSFGVEIEAGHYNTESVDLAIVDSTLSITTIKIGATYAMDNIWKEPIVAPYVVGGAYMVMYKEKRNVIPEKVDGNTFPAPYISGGVMFQLDWLEDDASRTSYQELSMENTFFFIEAEMLFESSEDRDPDFSSIHASAGLKLEF